MAKCFETFIQLLLTACGYQSHAMSHAIVHEDSAEHQHNFQRLLKFCTSKGNLWDVFCQATIV